MLLAARDRHGARVAAPSRRATMMDNSGGDGEHPHGHARRGIS
jgi:hypothetical protein